jgi:anti-sigma factor RsiW
MMGNLRCKWVHDRLPLLVGDELCGLDRRRVERHLIGCPQCRRHQASHGRALEALRTVAATAPAPPDAPSRWPALARHIRASRRPGPKPAFRFPFAFAFAMVWPRANPLPALGLGLGLLATLAVSLEVRQQDDSARARIAANRLPIAPAPQAPGPRLVDVPDSRREVPPPVVAPVVEIPPAPPRLDFDQSLEHGRPMSPDVRDSRDTRSTY